MIFGESLKLFQGCVSHKIHDLFIEFYNINFRLSNNIRQ